MMNGMRDVRLVIKVGMLDWLSGRGVGLVF